MHFFQTQVNITTILGGGFILDILDIIFEARLNDVATLSKEDKTNTPYHSNSSAAYEKIEAFLNDFCPNNAYNILVAIDGCVSEINYEAGYFNEKYYKQGFCDSVDFMKHMLTKNFLKSGDFRTFSYILTFVKNRLFSPYQSLQAFFNPLLYPSTPHPLEKTFLFFECPITVPFFPFFKSMTGRRDLQIY